MLEGILQGLMQWIYGLFLDLMSYCANALLGIMSTDLSFFESSVPIVPKLYTVFVAIGWGLLIGNCVFQSMKAMFAGLGFETESPAILLLRTGLFGTLLIFSKDICDIGLSIGKNIIDLLGIPASVKLTMPTDNMFSGFGTSWLLVIIIGFILGFQLIKLFFEVAERYVVVAVLTLLCPVGLAMGGSKSTKDICVNYMRTYASMIVMMIMNVLFLKLILSALAAMPSGVLILPWCLLVVGIAKTARKADQLVSRIGLSPTSAGDPLGKGRGMMMAAMAARTILHTAGKGGSTKGSTGRSGSRQTSFSRHYGGNTGNTVRRSTGGTNVGGTHMAAGAAYAASAESNASTQQTNQNSSMAGGRTTATTQSASTVRFGANSYGGTSRTAAAQSGRAPFGSSGGHKVNTNRFGSQPTAGKNTTAQDKPAAAVSPHGAKPAGDQTTARPAASAKTTAQAGKGAASATRTAQNAASKRMQKDPAQRAARQAGKTRFGGAGTTGSVRHNAAPTGKPKTAMPPVGGIKDTPGRTKASARPDAVEAVDTAKEVLQNAAETVITPKGSDDDG